MGMKNNEFHTVRGYQLLKRKSGLLTPAMEDYLEMVDRNISGGNYMRVNTLAGLLNVRTSSATKMVQKLSQRGFLEYEKYGIISLTKKGEKLGGFLLQRHNSIERFLKTIGVDENLLRETELIEHTISENTLRCIECLNFYFEENPKVIEELKNIRQRYDKGL